MLHGRASYDFRSEYVALTKCLILVEKWVISFFRQAAAHLVALHTNLVAQVFAREMQMRKQDQ